MSGRNTVAIAPFTGGLNTETSLLSDAYNTTVSEKNFYITQQGTRQKRLGIDFEPVFKFNSTALGEDYKLYGYSCYEWKRPGTYGKSLYVIQCGRYLYFFDAVGRPFSQSQLLNTIDLFKFKYDDNYYKYPVSYSEGYGILYISGEHINTVQIGYGARTSGESSDAHCSISLDVPTQNVDFWGVYSHGFEETLWFRYREPNFFETLSLTNSRSIQIYYNNTLIASGSGTWTPNAISIYWNNAPAASRDSITATASGNTIKFTAPLGTGDTLNGKEIRVVVQPFNYIETYGSPKYYTQGHIRPAKDAYSVGVIANNLVGLKSSTTPFNLAASGAFITRNATMSGGLSPSSSILLWAEAVVPMVRDLSGVNDGLSIETRPSSITNLHQYNLYNQGWTQTWVDSFKSSTGTYPSNNLQWSIGRYQKAIDGSTATEWVFDPQRLLKYAFGNTPAAKGHYILNYYTKDRSGVSGIAGIPATAIATKRPCQSIHYAGRLFMLCGQDLLYSQVLVEDASNVNKCYQDADPTSEAVSDLVDTDGGVLALPSIGQGIGLATFEDYLIVFGDRGIVAINGDGGAGFKATGFNQRKISTEACLSNSSIVSTDAGVFFWSSSGIQQITSDKITALPTVANVSRAIIKTYINNIPVESIKESKAVYNRAQGRISWWYPSGTVSMRGLDRVLIFDIGKGIWYPWEISNNENSPAVVAPMNIAEAFQTSVSAKVFSNSTPIRAGTNTVIIGDSREDRSDLSNVLFIALDKYSRQFTFAEFYDKSFTDWLSSEGQASQYKATALSGPLVAQDVFKGKSLCYVLADFRRTELEGFFESSCKLQTRWQWNMNYDSYGWDEMQELYRPYVSDRFSDKIVDTKTRIRGIGEALQLYIESPEGYDCRIEGLGLDIQGIGR